MSRLKYDNTNPSLPEGMIEEVIARLPAKSVLRFRCVSKSFHSLIDSKYFVKIHHTYSRKNQSFPHQWIILHDGPTNGGLLKHCSLQSLCTAPSLDPPALYNPPEVPLTPYKIVGCCNGLLCIHALPKTICLWNPSTRTSKILPEVPHDITLVHILGFGWVESSGECKVFGILKPYREGIVYSSKTDSWKTIAKWDLQYPTSRGVSVGGKLYWKSRSEIVFVDLKSEVYGSVELPPDKELFFKYGMGELGGCLCVLYHNFPGEKGGVRVWVRKEYGVKDYSWERVVTRASVLDLLQRPSSAPSTVGQKGEIFLFCGTTFLIYYPQDNVFRFPKICYREGSQHVYVESLVSP